jgi:hypothetical protein
LEEFDMNFCALCEVFSLTYATQINCQINCRAYCQRIIAKLLTKELLSI